MQTVNNNTDYTTKEIIRNRHAAAAFLALLCATLCGCLSVVRVPVPVREAYSEEGICTNRVWGVLMDDIMHGHGFGWRAYPTVRMRCMVTAHVFSPIDRTKRGEDLYRERHKRWLAIPLALVWATSPLDAAVDTLFMPFDIGRTAKPKGKEEQIPPGEHGAESLRVGRGPRRRGHAGASHVLRAY